MNETVEKNTALADNPLSKYMRNPQIYISLPSGGKYWAPESLEMPINQELPVLSMSSYDELLLKTPDALMNGQSVVDIIQSCIKPIKNAWDMPVTDLDYCLIAIRIATYGEMMGYSSICPKCNEFNEYEIDLKEFLNLPVNMEVFDQIVNYDDQLTVKIKPRTYRDANKQNMEVFEQQRIVSLVNDESIDAEVKQEKFNEIFAKITRLSLATVVGSIEYIQVGETKYTQPAFIEDFVANTDVKVFRKVKDHHEITNKAIPDKTIKTSCPDCGHPYEMPFSFDHANFFALAS